MYAKLRGKKIKPSVISNMCEDILEQANTSIPNNWKHRIKLIKVYVNKY